MFPRKPPSPSWPRPLANLWWWWALSAPSLRRRILRVAWVVGAVALALAGGALGTWLGPL